MRKLLLLYFFLGGFVISVFAGQIQLFNIDGNKILHNSTIKINGSSSESINEFAVFVSNMQDFGGLLKIERRIIESVNGSDNRFYWNTARKKNRKKNFIDAFESNKELILEFLPNNYSGRSIIEFTVSLADKSEKAITFIVEYNISEASINSFGINNYKVSEVYPNPVISEAKFDYIFPTHFREAKIIIRSLLGSIIVEQAFEGTQGTLNISLQDAQNGIYFYSVIIEGEIKETKKLIIKH